MDFKTAVNDAVNALKNGGLILYPTDSVWALGCDATNKQAVEKITSLTKKEPGKGMVIIARDMNMVARFVKEIPAVAEEVAELSDQPVTIIYPKGVSLAPGVTAKDGSVAIRVVNHPFCNALLTRFGKPIVATLPAAGSSEADIARDFYQIDDAIVQQADWCADTDLDDVSTGKLSSLISLGIGGEVKIIRK